MSVNTLFNSVVTSIYNSICVSSRLNLGSIICCIPTSIWIIRDENNFSPSIKDVQLETIEITGVFTFECLIELIAVRSEGIWKVNETFTFQIANNNAISRHTTTIRIGKNVFPKFSNKKRRLSLTCVPNILTLCYRYRSNYRRFIFTN